MSEPALVADLKWDEDIYPRQAISRWHVTELIRALDAGQQLPPVVACRRTHRIVDGVHRHTAAVRRRQEWIETEWRDYPPGEAGERDLFADSVQLNSAHGLKMTSYDHLRVLSIAKRFALTEDDLVAMMRTTPDHLRALQPRFATLAEAREAAPGLRRELVALKAGTRHLAGHEVTIDQARAIAGAPGVSYLLLANQLISGLRHGLLPPPGLHPGLWDRLDELRQLLDDHAVVR